MKIKILCIGECKNELTLQEFKVLKLASEGLSNKEISELLFIGESTIKSHRRNIMQKLGITADTKTPVLPVPFLKFPFLKSLQPLLFKTRLYSKNIWGCIITLNFHILNFYYHETKKIFDCFGSCASFDFECL